MNRKLSILSVIILLSSFSCTKGSHEHITRDTLKPKLVVPVGHSLPLISAQFNFNGKLVVTNSFDGTAKIWDSATGRLIHTLEHYHMTQSGFFQLAPGVKSAFFSPVEEKVATIAVEDSKVKIWDALTGMLIHSLEGHTAEIEYAQFSPNGKKIITASRDSTAKIWDVSSGKLLYSIKGHSGGVTTAQFNWDGKMIVTASEDGSAKIWEASTGKLIYSLESHADRVNSIQFSSNGKYLLTAAADSTAKIWDVSTGNLLRTIQLTAWVDYAQFSADGKIVLTACNETAKIWDASTGEVIYSVEDLPINSNASMLAGFSPDGKTLLTSSNDHTARIWNIDTGTLIYTLKGHTGRVMSVQFSPDGKRVLTASWDQTASIWDAETGKKIRSMSGHTNEVKLVELSPDGALLIKTSQENFEPTIYDVSSGKSIRSLKVGFDSVKTASFSPDGRMVVTLADTTLGIWDVSSGQLIHSLEMEDYMTQAQFSPDSKMVAVFGDIAMVWDVATGKKIHDFIDPNDPYYYISSGQFSPDGRMIVTASELKISKLWDVLTGKLIHTLKSKSADFFLEGSFSPAAKFNPAGKIVVLTTDVSFVEIWDVFTGKVIKELLHKNGHQINSAEFSSDGRRIVTSSNDMTAIIWEVASGKPTHSLKGHSAWVTRAEFSPDGKRIITTSPDKTTKVWDTSNAKQIFSFAGTLKALNWNTEKLLTESNSVLNLCDLKNGKILLSWIELGNQDWVVTHPSGLFDASPGAMDKLYFVQGLDIIEFNQLKERYYEPGLWKKVMAGEALRNVVGMKSIELPPDIQVGRVDDEGYLSIQLTNRGGGIGEVNLYLNGKEIIKDARDPNAKTDAASLSLKIFVGKHKSIVKGQENFIGVKAWNTGHWVVSRGHVVSYQSKEIENYKPAIHILSCGISDYTGNEIDLKYAAKDANDMSLALQIGAKKLFGVEKSYAYSLTTSQPKEFHPTKTNILKVFEKISSISHPLDFFVMYVSGHGINYGGQDGDWHYLTQEAYTGNGAAYNDPAIRAQTTISSNELVELFKKVPALKQVLILDACASGKVVDNLMAQKNIESSILRALDRMRDRTGLHIITGCTADAVSYEASKYGQGVLTYSLLEGIRGAALREEQYIDVNKLFQYAQDRVPQLAEGIGGIQSPQVFSPKGSQSFDIGLLSDVEKKAIPIAKIRPVFVRSNFQDENEMEDVLGFGKLINESLNEVSSKGIDSPIIFVDVLDYPDGCKLIGRYKKENGKIILKLRKKCGTDDKTYDLKADNVEMMKAEVLKVL